MKRFTPHFGGNPRTLCQPGGENGTWADCTTANIPADAVAGYENGCILQVKDATTGLSNLYTNTGSRTSSAFRPYLVASAAGSTTAITATPAQLNAMATSGLGSLLSSSTQIDNNNYSAARLVATTATQITVTAAAHDGKDLVLTSTHTTTVTLPAASGSGSRYNVIVGVTGTDGSKIVQVANTTDIIQGASIAANTQSTTVGFISSATSDTITLNNTTTGGLLGTRITIVDVAAGTFLANVQNITTGNPATPWSAAV